MGAVHGLLQHLQQATCGQLKSAEEKGRVGQCSSVECVMFWMPGLELHLSNAQVLGSQCCVIDTVPPTDSDEVSINIASIEEMQRCSRWELEQSDTKIRKSFPLLGALSCATCLQHRSPSLHRFSNANRRAAFSKDFLAITTYILPLSISDSEIHF